MQTAFELFKAWLLLCWPPNLWAFAAGGWKGPLSGTGMGPGLYALFLPFLWLGWLLALAFDVGIVVGVVTLVMSVDVTWTGI